MNKFLQFLANHSLAFLLTIHMKSLRFRIQGDPDIKPAVYIFWHSQMLAGWWLFRNKKYSALVSQSKDGDILNKVLSKWNYEVLRGSSSKGGKEALEEIIQKVSKGSSGVITPDGPRGPAREIKNGALIISNRSSVPVIPVKVFYHNKIVLQKSWDKFEIPFPFSKCEVSFGGKFYYKEFLEEDRLSKLKAELSSQM